MSPDRVVAPSLPERSVLLSPLPVRRTLGRQAGSKPTSPPRGVVSTRLVRDIDRVERIERVVGVSAVVAPVVAVVPTPMSPLTIQRSSVTKKKVTETPMSPSKPLPARIVRSAVVAPVPVPDVVDKIQERVSSSSRAVSHESGHKKLTLSMEGITLHAVKMTDEHTVVLTFSV